MSTELMMGLITIVSTVISGWAGWFFGRRKQNAEASILEAKGLAAIREFYESVQKDNNKALGYYIQLSEDNRRELHLLRKIVDKLIDDACLKKGCGMRVYYSPEGINQIIKVEPDESKDE